MSYNYASQGPYAGGLTLGQKLQKLNWLIILVTTVLTAIGGAMLYSVAAGDWALYASSHVTRFLIFFVLMIAAAVVPIRFWLEVSYPLYLLAFVLLVGVELFGDISLGARRWLQLGPVRLQPSEIMKIAIILALARYFHNLPDFRRLPAVVRELVELLPPLLMIAAPAALIMHQPDLGTALLVVMTGALILFLAGLRWSYIGFAAVGGVSAMAYAYFFILHDYQRKRIDTFMNPSSDPLGAGYHITQSKIAIGSGGVFGRGYMQGSQSQLDFLPEKHTDFIFTMTAEELGITGAVMILALYGVLLYLALMVAMRARGAFSKLTAGGIAAALAIYVFINAGMVMGLLPVVGVPMPLVSFGGTVMMSVMIGIGILLCIDLNRSGTV